MKIVQTVAEISAESSGPSYSIPGLCKGLRIAGAKVSLHVRAPLPSNRTFGFDTVAYQGVDGRLLRKLGVTPKMLTGLRKVCKEVDIIQVNGLWMMQNVYPYWATKGTKCKLVVAPRGTLAAWSLRRSWLQKRIFWWLFQRQVLKHADMFYATCVKEYEEIRAAGFKQPVAIIPIGMDLPNVTTDKIQKPLKRVAFFGRIHEVKCVDRLVRAWGEVAKLHEDWELVIAGPDCGAKSVVENIVAEGKIPRVRFVGEINGAAKYEFLKEADLYVLPSMTENFGITVAEALVCETPCIVSKGAPWSGLVKENAGWWVENDIATLAKTLENAISLPADSLHQMGVNGKDWIKRDFTWEGVGVKSLQAYEWLLGRRELPDFVKVD